MRDGEEANFDTRDEEFWNSAYARLMGYVQKHLWQRGKSSVDSVVHSILLSYVENHQGVAIRGEEDDLLKIILRHAFRHCKKHNKRTERGVPAQFSQLTTHEEDGFDPQDEVSDQEWVDEMAEQIEHIDTRLERVLTDERERRVFRLYLLGHSYKQIADMTNLTVGRVRAVKKVINACIEEKSE
jgi:RNA polymerase sigma factor (sigma-70 family)